MEISMYEQPLFGGYLQIIKALAQMTLSKPAFLLLLHLNT